MTNKTPADVVGSHPLRYVVPTAGRHEYAYGWNTKRGLVWLLEDGQTPATPWRSQVSKCPSCDTGLLPTGTPLAGGGGKRAACDRCGITMPQPSEMTAEYHSARGA